MITKTTLPYEFLVRFKDGKIAGAHVQMIERVMDGDDLIAERALDAQPVTDKTDFPLAELLGQVNSAALATIEDLKEQIAELEKRPVMPEPSTQVDLLATLSAKFDELLPPEAQAAFAVPFATVRVLVQAGRMDLARSVIEETPVPKKLGPAKAELLTLF
jgi:hypothetical protein